MVEGPGATRNGKKAKATIGRTVAQVISCKEDVNSKLASSRVNEVFTVGKELFLVFSSTTASDHGDYELALRVHFGMSGSLQVGSRDRVLSSLPPWRRQSRMNITRNCADNLTTNDPSFIRIEFDDSNDDNNPFIMEARQSTFHIVSAKLARTKLSRLSKLDVCGDASRFDATAVVALLASDKMKGALISDAIMNQDVFPGVGNIIKNESLHQAGIDPRRLCSSLTTHQAGEMINLIARCRKYSMDWLRTGRAGKKHVYNKTDCQTCSRRISIQKVGGKTGTRIARVTFWCSFCQPFDANVARAACIGNDAPIESNEVAVTVNSNKIAPSLLSQQPLPLPSKMCCPKHGDRQVVLRRVRKVDNHARIFVVCRVPACQFFSWADQHLPNCLCGKKSVMRISKTSSSGGKWFICCGNGRSSEARNFSHSNGCGYFAWASPSHLAYYGNKLTPLL